MKYKIILKKKNTRKIKRRVFCCVVCCVVVAAHSARHCVHNLLYIQARTNRCSDSQQTKLGKFIKEELLIIPM